MSAVRAEERRINIVQGDYVVEDNPDVVIATLLGSCIAACIRDPFAGVGGMNHFLLPEEAGQHGGQRGESYAVHLMELLVNGLMRNGARRDRMEAKLFGGAKVVDGLSDVGARNAEFARRFLRHEDIRLVGCSLGGTRGRRVQFWPVSGRARQLFIGADLMHASPAFARKAPIDSGDVQLF